MPLPRGEDSGRITGKPEVTELLPVCRPCWSYHSEVTGCKHIHQFVGLCVCNFGTVGYEKGKTPPREYSATL
jgi:hypothetical protein